MVWLCVELLHYIYYKKKLTSMQQLVPPLPLSRDNIEKNFDLICQYLADEEQAKKFLCDWFFGARFEDIYRDNLTDWMAWAFYGCETTKLTSFQMEMLDKMIPRMEAQIHGTYSFPLGRNPELRSARLNLDPIMAHPRSIFVYLVVFALECVAHTMLWLKGFRHHKVLLERRDGTLTFLTYYHRCIPSTSTSVNKGKSPLMFLHGIGIGLVMYLPLLSAIWDDREMLIVRMPEVANQSLECPATPAVFVKTLSKVLRHHAIESVCLMGHSYGTVVMAWVMKQIPQSVSGAIFLDPVCFLLFLPYTCMHFIYEVPEFKLNNLRACIVHYFAKRELGIAHTLQRHFWWTHNNIWSEDLCDNIMVVLAAEDEIAPAPPILNYLENHNKSRAKQGRPLVDIAWHPTGCHADCIARWSSITKIRQALDQRLP